MIFDNVLKMRAMLFIVFIVLSGNAFSQQVWQYVGANNITGSIDTRSTEIAFDMNNVPYLACRSYSTDFFVRVYKYDAGSAQWELLDTTGIPLEGSLEVSFAIDGNNTPYVAYTYFPGGSNSTIAVIRYDDVQSQWEPVGTFGFATGTDVTIDFDNNNVPFLAYANNGVTVVKYIEAQSQWVHVGSPNFANGNGTLLKMAMNGDTPYVAFQEIINGELKSSVMKYDQSQWVMVGNPGFANSTLEQKLAVAQDGTPYLLYRDLDYNFKATVMKYDQSQWVTVGMPGFSLGVAGYLGIAVDNNNVPYVGFEDGGNLFDASVFSYDNSQAGWAPVGSSGFTGLITNYNSLALNGNNVPYVAFTAFDEASVMKFDLPVGLEDLEQNKSIRFFPNPTSNKLSITFEHSFDEAVIHIYSMNMQQAYHTKFQEIHTGQELGLDVSTLKPGIYMIQITTEQGLFQDKFTITR